MIEYAPFRAAHLRFLAPQDIQRREHAILLNSEYAMLVDNNFGLSAWRGSECIAAAGCVPIFAHKAAGWAILSASASPYMLSLVRKFRSTLRLLPYKRIEMSVRADFPNGIRFAELIGMKKETPEPMYYHGAQGEAEYMYSMTRWQH